MTVTIFTNFENKYNHEKQKNDVNLLKFAIKGLEIMISSVLLVAFRYLEPLCLPSQPPIEAAITV